MKVWRKIILSIMLTSMLTQTVLAAPRVIYEIEPITDKKAEILLKWSEPSQEDIRFEGFEVISQDMLKINYKIGDGGSEAPHISLLLDEVTFPMNVILSNNDSEEPFEDLNFKGESLDAILNLYYQGIINGYDDGEFKPYNSVKREEFAVMLVKTSGITVDPNSTSSYTDVSDTRWSEPYITALSNKGIISGSNGKFRPEDKVTIGEVATMLERTFMFYQREEKSKAPELNTHWARDYMHTLYETDLMRDRDNFYNLPDRNATREDCALLLNRVLMSLKDVK